MEILVSDDCSQDGTWEVLQDMAGAYKGPHDLRLMRNESNLGIIRNLEKAFRAASGQLIVKADGDDVSEPGRVRRIEEEWDKCGHEAMFLAHGTALMDVDGNAAGHRGFGFSGWSPFGEKDMLWGRPRHYQGNSCAYRRELISGFPPVEFPGAVDDLLLTLRAIAMAGRRAVWHFPDELTRYRMGCGRTNDYSAKRRTVARTYGMILNAFLQFRQDLARLEGAMEPGRHADFVKWTDEAVGYYRSAFRLYSGESLGERLGGFAGLGARGWLSKRLPLFLGMLLSSPGAKS